MLINLVIYVLFVILGNIKLRLRLLYFIVYYLLVFIFFNEE